MLRISFIGIIFARFAAPQISSAATLADNLDIECHQPTPQSLVCDYRMLHGQQWHDSSAEFDGIELPGGVVTQLAHDSVASATLFVVDTSDPSRSAVLQRNREHIAQIVGGATRRQNFALSAFESELNILCPFNCVSTDILANSQALVAKGKTTELYRNLLEAIKYLRGIESPQRQIILMSDGLAEDLVYFHQDVIAAARKDSIVISTIGYPRSISQSVALQTLRRLSEETGGVFIPANAVDFSVPEGSFSRLLSFFDHVGKLSFMLDSVPLTPLAQPIEMQLNFRSNENRYFVLVPIVLPELKPLIAPEQSVAATALATANASPAAATTDAVAAPRLSEQNTQTTWTWFWYGLPAIVFSAILALTLGSALLARRRRDEQRSRDQPSSSFAYLIPVGNEQTRHKLDRMP